MSKTMLIGAAAIGGMAFFTLITRYSLLHSMIGGAGDGGDAGGTCSNNACGPREGEVVKGEEELTSSDEQWRAKLTPQQFNVTRRKGTEPAFTGKYWDCHKQGVYRCVCCGAPLFASDTKFDSGTGWPSFWQPIGDKAVEEVSDYDHGRERKAVESARNATPTWAMFSTTGRGRPACDIASTPLRWCLMRRLRLPPRQRKTRQLSRRRQ